MPMLSKSDPSPRQVKAVQMEPESLWRKGFVKQMSFKSGEKDRASDRWWRLCDFMSTLFRLW